MRIRKNKVTSAVTSPPLLIVISGPSGAGKDATLAKMKDLGSTFHYVVTATTRPKRQEEIDRVHYRFISDEQFQKMVKEEKFLEWAKVYGYYYGVPKDEIQKALDLGQDVIIKVDVQGAATIKRLIPEAIFIFVTPPSLDELTTRLKQRNNHRSSSDLKIRLATAQKEIESMPQFDYLVVNYNNNIGLTAAKINAIILAEKCRVNHRNIEL